MRRLWLAVLCLVLLAVGSKEAGEVDFDRPEQNRVVNALFSSIEKDGSAAQIVLEPRSAIVDISAQRLKAALPEASHAVIEDLLAISSKPIPTQPIIGLPDRIRITVVTRDQLEKIFDARSPSFGWYRFYREFPGSAGIIRLSRVGLDPKAGQALIYADIRCGRLCGTGYVILLRPLNGDWVIARSAHLWVS